MFDKIKIFNRTFFVFWIMHQNIIGLVYPLHTLRFVSFKARILADYLERIQREKKWNHIVYEG